MSCYRLSALVMSVGLYGAPAIAAPYTIATINFDSANAVTTASISGGGYVTPFGTALHSGTSPDWSVPDSLGTHFQMPTFQAGYDPNAASFGAAGGAVTLGQDANFPQTSLNERDIILLDWGSGNGLANQTGNDLAVFEAATSEAYAIRVHSINGGGYWSTWYYLPYLSGDLGASALANDTTPTLFDFSALGLADDELVNAIEITNLLIDDTVGSLLAGETTLGYGEVYFGGSTIPGQNYTPARYSSSQAAYVPFTAGKFDPDIQYVVGLHNLTLGGVPDTISALTSGVGDALPIRLAATDLSVPVPAAWLLVLPGLFRLATRQQAVRS